jgi:hypothetical protein
MQLGTALYNLWLPTTKAPYNLVNLNCCPPTDASYMSPPFCIVNTITPSAYFTFAEAQLLRLLPKPEPQIRFTILNRAPFFGLKKPLPDTLVRLLEIRCSVAITLRSLPAYYVRRRLHFQPPPMINHPYPLGRDNVAVRFSKVLP